MVDTLAVKKVFQQRDLDRSLSSSAKTDALMSPTKSVLESIPKKETVNPLINSPQFDYIIDREKIFDMMNKENEKKQVFANEQNQTIKSSQETQDVKQTGAPIKKDVSQGLVMKPISYAADGFNNKKISDPILVGEEGAELVVPTGDGTISILDAATTRGLMHYPGYGDELYTIIQVTLKLIKDLQVKLEVMQMVDLQNLILLRWELEH